MKKISKKKYTILITGHKGYLGSHINNYFEENYFKEFDIYHLNDLKKKNKIKKIDYIIHLAFSFQNNNMMSKNKLLLKKIIDIKKNFNSSLFFFSSSAVYGINQKKIKINENYIKKPISLYGEVKLELEKVLIHLASQKDIKNIFILRLFNIVGGQTKKTTFYLMFLITYLKKRV